MELDGKFLSFAEAIRLRDQLNQALLAHRNAGPLGRVLRERDEILDVFEPDRTAAQRIRLRLDRTHSVLTSTSDRNAMNIIRKAAKRLREKE